MKIADHHQVIRILEVNLEQARPLRQTLIVPGSTDGVLAMPEDADSDVRHFAAALHDDLVGIVSTLPQMERVTEERNATRFYALAVLPQHQRAGIGQFLIAAAQARAQQQQASMLWGFARTSALGFFRRTGFRVAQSGRINPATGMTSYLVQREVAAP